MNQGHFHWSQPQNIPAEITILFLKNLEYEEGTRFRELLSTNASFSLCVTLCEPEREAPPCPVWTFTWPGTHRCATSGALPALPQCLALILALPRVLIVVDVVGPLVRVSGAARWTGSSAAAARVLSWRGYSASPHRGDPGCPHRAQLSTAGRALRALFLQVLSDATLTSACTEGGQGCHQPGAAPP